MAVVESLPWCTIQQPTSADLGCSSEYSMERVDVEGRRGEGFRVDRKGAWLRRTLIIHGQLRGKGQWHPAWVLARVGCPVEW